MLQKASLPPQEEARPHCLINAKLAQHVDSSSCSERMRHEAGACEHCRNDGDTSVLRNGALGQEKGLPSAALRVIG